MRNNCYWGKQEKVRKQHELKCCLVKRENRENKNKNKNKKQKGARKNVQSNVRSVRGLIT